MNKRASQVTYVMVLTSIVNRLPYNTSRLLMALNSLQCVDVPYRNCSLKTVVLIHRVK